LGDDGQAGVADIGQQIDSQFPQGYKTEKNDGQKNHKNGHWPFDRELRDLHLSLAGYYLILALYLKDYKSLSELSSSDNLIAFDHKKNIPFFLEPNPMSFRFSQIYDGVKFVLH